VKEAKFPDVFRETSTQKRLAAALEFTDLDEKQKPAIKSLQANYMKEATSLNEKLATASEKDEARRLADPNLGFGGRGGGQGGQGGGQPGGGRGGQGGGQGGRGGQGGGGAQPAADPNSPGSLRQAKRDLDTRTMESLRKILTQDQQDRLPRPDPRDRMGGGGNFGNGGGNGGGNNNGGGQRRNRGNGA
jgi:translation initiation factor IF-2